MLPNDSIGVDIPDKYQLIIDARDQYIHNDQVKNLNFSLIRHETQRRNKLKCINKV